MVQSEEDLVRYLAEEARRAQQQVTRYRRELERRIEQSPELMVMASTVGKVTSAALVSLVGSPGKYESARSYQKSMGLNLKEVSSGQRRGRLSITKRRPGRARYWLYLATLRLIQEDEVVAAWYQAKVKRDGGLKSKAVVALMRNLEQGRLGVQDDHRAGPDAGIRDLVGAALVGHRRRFQVTGGEPLSVGDSRRRRRARSSAALRQSNGVVRSVLACWLGTCPLIVQAKLGASRQSIPLPAGGPVQIDANQALAVVRAPLAGRGSTLEDVNAGPRWQRSGGTGANRRLLGRGVSQAR
jgi:hypothetical protein